MGGSNRVVPEREAELDNGLTIERAKELGGAFIPAFIIARPDLTHAQKLVWGKVCGLAGKHGYCWASNKWLGENLLMEARTVREHVQVLVDKNLLRRDVIRDEKGQVIERRLYPMWPQESSDVPPPAPERRTPSVGRAPEGGSPQRRTSVARAPIEVRSEVGDVDGSTSEPKPKPAPRVKVQKADLDHLTDRYAALKGVRPQGKEWLPIQQGFRRALLDGNTVEQIEGCMNRIVALDWPWTINTVRRWLPEHRAGKMEEFQAISQRNGDAGGVPEWVDEAVDQYRRIMGRAASIAQEITEERSREPFDPEAIPERLRQTMGKMLDGAEAGDTVDAVAIAEMEARRGELEERARDIVAKLEKAGFAYRLEKVRV